ncbi:unnamed protein product, partial [Chrysoparadoxa australica]
MSIPKPLKPLTTFIKRAEELDKGDAGDEEKTLRAKVVAYYCRTFAMELGMKASDGSGECTTFLGGLMDQLEQGRKSMPDFTEEDGKSICTEFALDVFGKADEEDRAGFADKGTARTFYAAGAFLEILQQFGELDEDMAAKKKYCKWKAADLLKAFKEGRQPTPGAPGE